MKHLGLALNLAVATKLALFRSSAVVEYSPAVKRDMEVVMATSGAQLVDGGNRVAGANLSSNQYCAVKQSTTARQVVLASTGGEAIAGVLQNSPASGQVAIIAQRGITQAQVGTAGFAAGDQLMTETSTGKFVTKTSTNAVVGVAIEAGVSGSVATIDLGATG